MHAPRPLWRFDRIARSTIMEGRQDHDVRFLLDDVKRTGDGERVHANGQMLAMVFKNAQRQDDRQIGRNGGPDGDIYLHIKLAPHPVFRPDHRDLYFDLTLSPWEAALGTEVEVPTLEGPVLLTIPPGTRNGRKLRLRGRGLAAHNDLYALVHIDVPTTLSPRERELFQELAKVSSFRPRAATPQENRHDTRHP